MNPDDEVTTMGGRQFLEKLPSLGVLPESLGDVAGQVRDDRFCGVGIVRWRRYKASLCEQAGGLEISPPFSIEVRPFAGGFSRRDLHSVSIVIESFDQTVDPSEAQGLSNHIFVRDRLLPGVAFVENEPDPWAQCVVLCEPCAPLFAGSEVHRHEF